MLPAHDDERDDPPIPEQAMLRALVDGTSDAVYVKDVHGRYLLFNKAASEIVGQPAEAVLGRDDTAIFSADEAQAIMAGDRRVMHAGEVQTYEEVLTDATGATRTFLSTKGPVRTPDGAVAGIFGIARDITPLREAEAERLSLAGRLQSTMDNMLEGCQILGPDWTYLYINDAAERHNRRPKEELVGRKYAEMWPGIESTEVYRLIKDCLENRVAHLLKNEFEFPDGRHGWFELDIQPVPEGVFILSVDITERTAAEKALREALDRLRTFVDSNIVGVIVADRSGAIVEANKYYLDLIGYTRDELEAGQVDWRSLTPPEWLPADERAIREMDELGSCTPYEKQYLRRDGSRVWVYLADAVLPGPEELIAAIAIDITDRKRAEAELDVHRQHLEELVESRTRELESSNQELDASNEELQAMYEELDATNSELQATNVRLEVSADAMRRLNRELLEATQAKSQFLTSMSHELRTPLNSIIGFSDILHRGMVGDLSEEQHKQIGMIFHSGQHLLSLINEVLDLSKIEAGAVDIDIAEVDLTGLVREIADTLHPLAAEKDVELCVDVPERMYSAITDENKVRQILLNLGGNAIKFTDVGSVEIRVRSTATEFRVAVQDTGRGIPSQELPRIFDEFAQIDQADHVKPQGTGLGLAISRRYAELLGGKIEVTSEPGVGSTFTLVLPVE